MTRLPSGYLSAALAKVDGPVAVLATGHELQLDGEITFDLDFAAETVRIEGDLDSDSMVLSDARIAGLGKDVALAVELPHGGEWRIEEPGDHPVVIVEGVAFVSLAAELGRSGIRLQRATLDEAAVLADLGNGTASIGVALTDHVMGLIHIRTAGPVPPFGRLEVLAVTDTTALDQIGIPVAVAVGVFNS